MRVIILFLILATPSFSITITITDTERLNLMFIFGQDFADRVEGSLTIGEIGYNVAMRSGDRILVRASALEEFRNDCVLFHEAYHMYDISVGNRSPISGRRTIDLEDVQSGHRLSMEQEANVAQVIGLWNVHPPVYRVREIEFDINYDTYLICLAYAKKYMKIDSKFLF